MIQLEIILIEDTSSINTIHKDPNHDQSKNSTKNESHLNSMITGCDSLAPRLIPAAARAASSAPISLAVRNLACSVTGLRKNKDEKYSIREVL